MTSFRHDTVLLLLLVRILQAFSNFRMVIENSAAARYIFYSSSIDFKPVVKTVNDFKIIIY